MPEFKLETIIESCVIYQRGVKVTRRGKIALPEGAQTLTTELPEVIDPDSVRVKGQGDGMILNINVEENFREETPNENVKALAEELHAEKKTLKQCERQKALLEQKRTQLGALQDNFYANFPKLFAAGESKIDRFTEFGSFSSSNLVEVLSAIRDVTQKIEEEKVKVDILQRKLQKVGQEKSVTRFYLLKVNVNVRKTGDFTLQIDAQSHAAYWTPLYDAILGEGEATIKVMANCVNNTGEDWVDVSLKVSTATMAAVCADKPTPYIVQEFVYAPPSDYGRDTSKGGMGWGGTDGTTGMAMDELVSDTKCADKAPPKPSTPKVPAVRQQKAQVSDAVGVQTFELPGKVSIPSDSDPHPVTLASTQLPSKRTLFWSSAKPDLIVAQDALTNKDLVLLAGKVKAYYNDEFIGETAIPLVAPNEEFKIGARASFDLKVTKKLVDRSKEKKLVKNKFIQNYAYEIDIKNLSKSAGMLKVYDRIPHADSEKIKVLPTYPDLPPTKERMGILKWKLDLKDVPDQKKIRYTYNVEWDKDVTITPPLP